MWLSGYFSVGAVAHTSIICPKMIPLLINCIADFTMLNAVRSLLLFVTAVYLRQINWLLDDTPRFVVEQIKITATELHIINYRSGQFF